MVDYPEVTPIVLLSLITDCEGLAPPENLGSATYLRKSMFSREGTPQELRADKTVKVLEVEPSVNAAFADPLWQVVQQLLDLLLGEAGVGSLGIEGELEVA